jgi:hypothetical protein
MTDNPLKRPTPCNVREIPSAGSSYGAGHEILLPLIESEPEVGCTKPEIALKSVVLPAPFGSDKADSAIGSYIEIHIVEGNEATKLNPQLRN